MIRRRSILQAKQRHDNATGGSRETRGLKLDEKADVLASPRIFVDRELWQQDLQTGELVGQKTIPFMTCIQGRDDLVETVILCPLTLLFAAHVSSQKLFDGSRQVSCWLFARDTRSSFSERLTAFRGASRSWLMIPTGAGMILADGV
jgi:hypothetical protein